MTSFDELQKQYAEQMIEQEKVMLFENRKLIESFRKMSASKGFELSDNDFSYIPRIGIVATSPNLLKRLDPCLERDKEGLLSYSDLKSKYKFPTRFGGHLISNNYIIMASHYFRRGYGKLNNFSPKFIDIFWEFESSDVDTYISIDFDRVRINVDDSRYMEFDTWFGAPFNDDISNIPDGISQLKPPQDIKKSIRNLYFSDVISLDIKWETKNGIKTFQAQEFKADGVSIKVNGIDYHPVRYVHAEFDLSNRCFRHFDGAIQLFSEDEYQRRVDSDFNYNSKNSLQIKTLSHKLFKMNGEVDVSTWVEFTSQFLSGNPLAYEYFSGSLPEHIASALESIRNSDLKC